MLAMSPAIGFLPIPAGAHAAPASASALGNIDEEPSTSCTTSHPIRRQHNERFDREQGQSGRNGVRVAKLPGQLRHSSIRERDDLGTHAEAGLSQEGSHGLGRWGITDRDGVEGGPHLIANAVDRGDKVIFSAAVELASVDGGNQPRGLTPGTDISNGFEQFVVGDRLLAMKDRVGQVKYDVAADKVAGLPGRNNVLEIHGNQPEPESSNLIFDFIRLLRGNGVGHRRRSAF